MYIVGDSDAGTFGPYLQTLLDGTNIVDTELNYKVSSGLARPDFFDWPAELAAKVPEVDPDIVVATFGGNDSQGLAVEDGSFIVSDPVNDEAEWTEEYRARVGEAMDLMGANGATVIWVGIPNDDNPEVTAKLRIQDQAVRAEAAERPNVVFIDTWNRFSGRDGNWAEFVIDPRDGVGKDVRADDGFHLNTNGAEILALDIAQAIRDQLRTRGRLHISSSGLTASDAAGPRSPRPEACSLALAAPGLPSPPMRDTARHTDVERPTVYCCWPRAWMAARRAATWSGLNIVRRHARLSRASISHASSS